MTAEVRGPIAPASAGLLLLLLGLADIVFLNLWVFPRTIRPRAQSWLSDAPLPLPQLLAKVDVDRNLAAPALPPAAAPPIDIAAVPAPVPAPATAPRAPAAPPAPEQVAAAPTAAPARPLRIMFGYNDADLTAPALAALARVAQQRGQAQLRIEGHADNVGPPSYNHWLSEQRANAVADHLASLGWPRERMLVEAFGATRPAVPGRDVGSRRRNRRVDISMLLPGADKTDKEAQDVR
jgi:peptidoglycan-associated lipoprotein